MNATLAAWNTADEAAALEAMLACCGSKRWAAAMVALRPIASVAALSEAADRVWSTMQEADWLEAFACHPRIGERKLRSRAHASEQSAAWSQPGTVVEPATQTNACWPSSPRAIELYEAALRFHLHRVRHGQKRRRDACNSQAPLGQRSRS